MSPWQLERINDPRKPPVDPGPRERNEMARDDRERGDQIVPATQPSIIDDGE